MQQTVLQKLFPSQSYLGSKSEIILHDAWVLSNLKVGQDPVALDTPEFQKFDFAGLVLRSPMSFFDSVFFVG